MRKLSKTIGGSIIIGTLSKGCQLCMQGGKLVLFVTGLCENPANCSWYCPISYERKGRDVVYANERLVYDDEELIYEATLSSADGTGITGGEPLLVLNRIIHYIHLLKDHFGDTHHIHLYTGKKKINREDIKKLVDAGLDEIRFHILTEKESKVLDLVDGFLSVGIEIPAIPGRIEATKKLIKSVEKYSVDFLNVNELEFTETNAYQLKKRGFIIKEDSIASVEGSEKMAIDLLKWTVNNTELNIHYCPARLKGGVQLRNRLLRRAKNVAKPYENITGEGLLLKGVITVKAGDNLDFLYSIFRKYCVSDDLIYFNPKKLRIETSIEIAKKIADEAKKKGVRVGILEEYPTEHPRLETSYTPL
ncbi:MAG: radical SAM protein [Candidatus Jordarchaeum sp.]|uniref:radical SAM protein n=1 Tax=Candidatus Jordarchaeum sp. TaxID=2823881 RepID=UPI00404AEC89